MATVFDVAQYILEIKGTLAAVKLQKLVYYCQAWSLVWDEVPYGNLAPYQLSELTHRETPWIEARKGLERWERGSEVIPLDKIAEYYDSLI